MEYHGLFVACQSEPWEPGQTVYVPHTSKDYYEVILVEKSHEAGSPFPGFDLWRFRDPVLHETEPGDPMPWEVASPEQVEFIGNLLRSKRYERTETGLRNGEESFDLDFDSINTLPKPVAGALIVFLKACKDKKPDYPTFKQVEQASGKRKGWVIADVPEGKGRGDVVTAARRDGELRQVVLLAEHPIGGKTYWKFKSKRGDNAVSESKQLSKLYRYVIDYYLDEPEEEQLYPRW